MQLLPLRTQDDHLFLEVEGESWLLDTGAPLSFCDARIIVLADKQFQIANNYRGLTAAALSKFVGVRCRGLLGADVLGSCDLVLDALAAMATVSTDELAHAGHPVILDQFMGIPIVSAQIRGNTHRMFFDTGAQVSYFQDASLADFAEAGSVTDFYPGFGQFQTTTYKVEMSLGSLVSTLRCGALPDLLAASLMMANTRGIIGNQILAGRVVGYFPRRALLML
jgi:hypothetical protein